MNNFKKFVSLVLVVLIGMTLLVGCSSDESSQESSNNNTDSSSNESKNVTLRFMWWGGDDRHKATLDAIDLYMQKNPNVKIDAEYSGIDGYLQKLVTQLSGNTAADIIQIDVTWIPELAAQGDFFADLSQQKSIDTTTFDQNFLKQYSYLNDKLIGLPTGINASALLYNKDFFAKYGIDDKTVWNWDNLAETAKQVHQKDKNAYLLNFDATVSYYMVKAYVIQRTGNYWVNDDYSLGFDKQVLTDAFTYLDQLFKNGGIQPFSESAPFQGKPEQNPKWLNGELGMLWNWTSMYNVNKANIKNLGIAMIPVAPDAKDTGIIVRPSQLLTINKNSENAEEAAKFINWFFNDPEAAKILKDVRGLPPTETARKILVDNGLLDPALNEATTNATKMMGKPENGISQNQELEKISTDVIQELAYQKLTPEKAADELISRFEQKLSELKDQQK
ncbi:sugar ABC transporter substrate-binding protein [Mahella sp.]|uniref:ABC transporter substrate-binding protein n=1 Tax=Mahella sp. TaxID=2798721 RepID=UPI0025C082EF|nr:sugar ABC transporter substrate-binding protein [Mahella sp.]MBZ4664902.1 extracellular solute-binding protein family 1 [Mahella sp.]